jgi:hypothetical protein
VPGNFHLEWLHDVSITSPTNNQVLTYDSASSLWVNANNPADGVTSITATAPLTGGTITSTGSIGLDQTALSITRSQVSDFTSGTVAQAGTATYATTSGTAVFSTNSGTATYATTSGTAVNISGTVTQSQVTNLTSDLALKAPLASPTFSGTVTLPFASSGLLQSGTAGAILKSDPAPGLGYIPYTASTSGNYAWLDLGVVAREDQANTFTVGGHSITSQGTAVIPLVLKAAASQSANLLEIQNSAATILTRINSSGNLFVPTLVSTFNGSFTAGNATTVPMLVKGAASQSANLQEWQNSAGTVLGRVRDSGQIGIGSLITATNFAINLDTVGGASAVGAVIRGATSQTANLQEWQNSGGTAIARVDNAGAVIGQAFALPVSAARLDTLSTGGVLTLLRATATPSSPGSNSARLYFRDGTNAGTLKLVVRAGTAGAETTILDNIPQT